MRTEQQHTVFLADKEATLKTIRSLRMDKVRLLARAPEDTALVLRVTYLIDQVIDELQYRAIELDTEGRDV